MSTAAETKPKRTIIPFGPQHPVLPEPIHLDLVLEDEKVVEVIPSIGFIHRGLEKLVEIKDFQEMTYVAERICGICSCIHGHSYCEAIENIMNIIVPERAKYLRVFWDELSRIHSHILWAGLFADSFGFESLFMHSWRIRERIIDIVEETTGGRVIFGYCKIGGTRRDIANDRLKSVVTELKAIEKECHSITEVFAKDYSVKKRTKGIGMLSKDDAVKLGAVGPMMRASGIASDARKLGYAAYGNLKWEPITESGCDCHARLMVRCREIYQAFDLAYQAADKMPDGPIETKVTGNPTGEFAARLEQPRGEVIYYVKGNGTKNLARFRVRTPTFANIPPLLKALEGCELPDVPVIVLTIDPCISCAER
jgi:ech hydrogenase subunit E